MSSKLAPPWWQIFTHSKSEVNGIENKAFEKERTIEKKTKTLGKFFFSLFIELFLVNLFLPHFSRDLHISHVKSIFAPLLKSIELGAKREKLLRMKKISWKRDLKKCCRGISWLKICQRKKPELEFDNPIVITEKG